MDENNEINYKNIDELQNQKILNNDKIQEANNKIENIKNNMIDNIDKIIERGEKVNTLDNESIELLNVSKDFENNSQKLKKKMCIRKYLIIFLIIFVLIFFIVIIALLSK